MLFAVRWVFISSRSPCLPGEDVTLLDPERAGGGGRGEGSSDARMINSQLPFRNLLFYDTQTLKIIVFIFKTCSDKILAKLINQGGCCWSFPIKRKNFHLLENQLKLTWGGQFWVKKNDFGDNNSFFLKLNPFPGGNIRIRWLVPFFKGKFCDVISPKIAKLIISIGWFLAFRSVRLRPREAKWTAKKSYTMIRTLTYIVSEVISDDLSFYPAS